jgi:hypothetical protein
MFFVSDKFLSLLGSFGRALFTERLNTKLNLSTAQHPRTYGLTVTINQITKTLLRCLFAESGDDWTFHLSIIELYNNCSINEATAH